MYLKKGEFSGQAEQKIYRIVGDTKLKLWFCNF